MTRQSRPLLLTADSDLLDGLLGVAAAVGVAVDVAVELATCRPQWSTAPLVLVGADLADALLDARLPVRSGVLVVVLTGPVDGLYDLLGPAGAEDVVAVDTGEDVLLARLADTNEPAARARVLGVVGGPGGAGASVLAAALALTAAATGPAWLVDLDPLGGSADVGLGAEAVPGARWAELGVLSGRLTPSALRAALPQVRDVAVVAAGQEAAEPAPAAVRAVLAAAARSAGTVVVDLPRHATAARAEAVRTADDLLVVVPAELRALVAARQVLAGLGPTTAALRVVVRPRKGGLPVREIPRGMGLPRAGELPDEKAVRTAVLAGDAAGLLRAPALSRLCAAILGAPTSLRAAA